MLLTRVSAYSIPGESSTINLLKYSANNRIFGSGENSSVMALYLVAVIHYLVGLANSQKLSRVMGKNNGVWSPLILSELQQQ